LGYWRTLFARISSVPQLFLQKLKQNQTFCRRERRYLILVYNYDISFWSDIMPYLTHKTNYRRAAHRLALSGALTLTTLLSGMPIASADTEIRTVDKPNRIPPPEGKWRYEESEGPVTMRGVVTRGSDSGNFRLRSADNNREYTIRSDGRTVEGQRLKVEGYWSNGIVQATNVDKWRDDDNDSDSDYGNDRDITVRGTVTRGSDSGTFRLRDADSRREYTVRSDGRTVEGQRLEVTGYLRRGTIEATNVDRWNGDDNGNNNGNNGGRPGDNYNRSIVLRGTVTRGSDSGNFRLRDADSRREYTIRSTGRTVEGQRLRVEGYWNNGVIQATSVDRWNDDDNGNNNGNNGGGYGRTVTVRGTVTRGSESGWFRLRDADNNREYTVHSDGRTVEGQRLQVTGQLRGSTLEATSVDRWNGDGGGNNGGDDYGRSITVSGTVTRGSDSGNFQIRDDASNREYTVNSDGRTVRGQRLKVVGILRRGTIQATSVDRLNGGVVPPDNGGTSISVRGTVTRGSNGGTFTLRDASSNRDYTVRSNGRTVEGQKLKVAGYLRNGVIDATNVDKWDDGSSSGGSWTRPGTSTPSDGTAISITATVTQGSNSGTYQVRADGTGQVYNVKSSGRTVNGQRLKIRGNLRNGTLYATSVDKA
jgi:cytochrome c-type biogenesis protein CcmE